MSRYRVVLIGVTVMVLLSSVVVSTRGKRPEGPGDIISILTQIDNDLCGGFSATFEMQVPAHLSDADQGFENQVVVATCSSDSTALRAVSTYDISPIYQALGATEHYAEIDYDDLANLILWRSVETSVLFAKDLNDTLSNVEALTVDPAGTVIEIESHVQLERHLIADDNNTFMFEQFLLAAGRGYSSHLESIISVEDLPDNQLLVVAAGSFGEDFPGTWELVVDVDVQYLVRSATFTDDDTEEVVLEVTSTGLLESKGLAIAASGSLAYVPFEGSTYPISVVVTEFLGASDNVLLASVRDTVTTPLLDGDEIVDFRVDPPTRTFVGE